MSFFFTLFSQNSFVDWPHSTAGWWYWALFLCALMVSMYFWREANPKWERRQWVLLVVCLLLIPFTSFFLGITLSPKDLLPPPGLPIESTGPSILIVSHLPWMLAAGTLGSLPAMLIGGLTGLVRALFLSHSIFTPLEFALFAGIFSSFVHASDGGAANSGLRKPLPAAIGLILFFPIVHTIDSIVITRGPIVSRIDYALSRMWINTLVFAIQSIASGVILEIISRRSRFWWGYESYVRMPSNKRGISTRLNWQFALLFIATLVAMVWGIWHFGGQVAAQNVRAEMEQTADSAGYALMHLIESGQYEMQQLVDYYSTQALSLQNVQSLLEASVESSRIFSSVFLFDSTGVPWGGYPQNDFEALFPTAEERVGVDLATRGIESQYYGVPASNGSGGYISFIQRIQGVDASPVGVILGRIDLATSSSSQSMLLAMSGVHALNGESIVLDGSGQIIQRAVGNVALLSDPHSLVGDESFFEDIGMDGTRVMIYRMPITGFPWTIVVAVPSRITQEMALRIGGPLLGYTALALAVLWVGLNYRYRSSAVLIKKLTRQAERISKGDLTVSMQVKGPDDLGQLSWAIDQMRLSLKNRIEELNHLLAVSRGVSSSFNLEAAINPVLETALTSGASAVYVVLSPEARVVGINRFGSGPSVDRYRYLDEQIMQLMQRQDQVVLTNPARAGVLSFVDELQTPGAILALAMRHASRYFGALWIAYDNPHQFTDQELRFFQNVTEQAALAAANTRLYLEAEIDRGRLTAILTAMPEPVLVIDQDDVLLLANPAARKLINTDVDIARGQRINRITSERRLIKFVRSNVEDGSVHEIRMSDGRVYLASVGPVLSGEIPGGRVFVFHDITALREMDDLKTELVDVVSHDLRSPIMLMRGYAKMLQMVGELNEQQTGYVNRIVDGLEGMIHMVQNLLDLSRIESGAGLRFESVSILAVVRQVLDDLAMQSTQKRIDLKLNSPDGENPIVAGDSALLQRAVHNLVDNAIKYTDSGKVVQVLVTLHPENVVIAVQDQGVGIAPVDQPRLFDRFYRSRRGEEEMGSGLGLAIVKSIVERHHGRVWLDSQLGRGSTFFLEIPLKIEGQ